MILIDRVTDTRTLFTWAEFAPAHRARFVERITRFVDEMGS